MDTHGVGELLQAACSVSKARGAASVVARENELQIHLARRTNALRIGADFHPVEHGEFCMRPPDGLCPRLRRGIYGMRLFRYKARDSTAWVCPPPRCAPPRAPLPNEERSLLYRRWSRRPSRHRTGRGMRLSPYSLPCEPSFLAQDSAPEMIAAQTTRRLLAHFAIGETVFDQFGDPVGVPRRDARPKPRGRRLCGLRGGREEGRYPKRARDEIPGRDRSFWLRSDRQR